MLAYIKQILRIASNEFDAEIQELIDSAKADLKLSGVREELINDSDTLIKRAVATYCKTHFGFDNKDHLLLLAAYNSLKTHLIVSTDYGKMD
jgi:predicted nucleic acid-binding protein